MVYSFQLWKHPNIHFREAVQRLSCCELLSMLRCLSIGTDIIPESLGSADFLTFESRELSPEELSWLQRHSCIVFQAEKSGSLLRPVYAVSPFVLPEELPEILKYKGKTSVSLTRMMLNTALALTPFARQTGPTLVLDPLCGRGTGLFCGLCTGMNAVGLDLDRRDLKEGADYFSRFLKLHRISHSLTAHSETVHGSAVPARTFRFSLSKEPGAFRSLTLFEGDTGLAGPLMKKAPAHVIIADLPYGVQHAPQAGRKPESFVSLLSRVLPSWKAALRPGGALAVSFNVLTLKAEKVRFLLSEAGFRVIDSPEYTVLEHTVEQAIRRDLVFASVPE